MDRNVYKGLIRARKNSPSKDYHLIVKSLLKHEKYCELAIGTPFPQLNEIDTKRPRLWGFSKEELFVWSACVISHYREELSIFNDLKNEYYHKYILGKYNDSKKILTNIEQKFGVSLWSINANFELIQKLDGLQAQKSYLEDIISIDGIDPVIAFFSNYFSLRNENNTTIETYLEEIESIIDYESLGDYATFHLLPSAIDTIKDSRNVLVFEEKNSIIDRYEALISMLELEASKANIRDLKYIKNCVRILNPIHDMRLRKLSFLFYEHKYEFNKSILDNYDCYTNGEYDFDVKPYASNLEIIVRQALFSNRTIDNYLSKDSIFKESVQEMTKMLNKSGDFISSKRKLQKNILIAAKSELSKHLSNFINRRSEFYLNEKRTQSEHFAALTIELENPWIIKTIEDISNIKNYGSILTKQFPNSQSLKLNLLLKEKYMNASKVIDKMSMPLYRKSFYLGLIAHRSGHYSIAEKHFKEIDVSINPYIESQVKENVVKVLFAQGKTIECIDNIVEHYLSNPSSISSYKITEFLEIAEKYHAEDSYQNISFCILLSIAARTIHPSWERKLSDAYENILDLYDVEMPSKLVLYKNEIGLLKIIYVLRYVAIPRILDDCILFDNIDEIEEERIKICQNLMEIDPSNIKIYSSEIRAITKEAKVTELVNHVNASKIFVNEEGVLSYIEDTLRRVFNKYKILLEQPELNFQVDKISERLKALLSDAKELVEINLPSSERMSLFETLYKTLITELAINPAYGLDTHVSTTIRHGAFEGQLRRAFDQQELMINKHSGKPRDRLSRKWNHYFKEINDHDLKHIVSRMEKFTSKIVEHINEYLTKYIRIRTSECQTGLFDFDLIDVDFDDLRNKITINTSYDEFINICIANFWNSAEFSMNHIQNKLSNELKPQMIKALDTLAMGINSNNSIEDIGYFNDAIVKAKIDLEANIVELCEWFTKPEQLTIEAFDLDLVTIVALKQINNCYVSSMLILEKNIDLNLKFDGCSFAGLVEVLFIFFQNVIRHSGIEKNEVSINISSTEHKIHISVVNKLGNFISIDSLNDDIIDLNMRYNDEMAMKFASTEGGSGLSKVWRILEYDLKVPHNLRLELKEDCKFVVNLEFEKKGLLYEN